MGLRALDGGSRPPEASPGKLRRAAIIRWTVGLGSRHLPAKTFCAPRIPVLLEVHFRLALEAQSVLHVDKFKEKTHRNTWHKGTCTVSPTQ